MVAAGLEPHAPQNVMPIAWNAAEVAYFETLQRLPANMTVAQEDYHVEIFATAHDKLMFGGQHNRGRAPDGRPS